MSSESSMHDQSGDWEGTTSFRDPVTGKRMTNYLYWRFERDHVIVLVSGLGFFRKPVRLEFRHRAVIQAFEQLLTTMRAEAWATRQVVSFFKSPRRRLGPQVLECPGCGGLGENNGFVCRGCDGSGVTIVED